MAKFCWCPISSLSSNAISLVKWKDISSCVCLCMSVSVYLCVRVYVCVCICVLLLICFFKKDIKKKSIYPPYGKKKSPWIYEVLSVCAVLTGDKPGKNLLQLSANVDTVCWKCHSSFLSPLNPAGIYYLKTVQRMLPLRLAKPPSLI